MLIKDYLDCNNCYWCTPKECEQTENKEPHICNKYNMRLFHRANTKIHPCQECLLEQDKQNK